MSNLLPSLVPLDKGLNLNTAKLVAPAGSVLSSLNYEQVDFQGQKRIDGFTRYDGKLVATLDEYYKITLTSAFVGAVGGLLSVTGGLLGEVVGVSGSIVYMALIDSTLIPIAGATLYSIVNGVNSNGNVIVAIVKGVDSGITIEEHYTNLLTYTTALRNRVESLPGTVVGLHWFRDRLYAVADVIAVSLNSTTPIIYPNDVLNNGAESAKVLNSIVLANTRVVWLDTLGVAFWDTPGTAITRLGLAVGTVANGFESFPATTDIASLYEARSEAQVLEEDGPSGPYSFGWRFIDHGWSINFEDGLSLYGSLPSLNQNITGIGILGPTLTTGDNGKPLILTQKVIITNKPAQVNGWKSSGTPLTFALEADNLISIDSTTIYGDMYITWDGTTGEVVALTDVLTEYPATNTIGVGP